MDDGKIHLERGTASAAPKQSSVADAAVQTDVNRMLAHATGKRAILLDEVTAREAVAATGRPVETMTPEERLTLYRVHDSLARAIAPATPDGVRTLEAYQEFNIRDRRSRRVMGGSFWALTGLLLAMSVHAYVATGSLIVQTIENARKDVTKVQAQVHAFDAAHPTHTVLGGEMLADNPARENERQRLRATASSETRRFDTAHDRLTGWLYLPLTTLDVVDVRCADDRIALQVYALRADAEAGAAPTREAATKREALVSRCGERATALLGAAPAALDEAYYAARQTHEQNARTAMELFSVVALPLVFGLLGASIAVLRDINQRLHDGSLDLTTLRCTSMRRLLGAAVGGISGIFFTPTHVLENWGLSLVALAFLLGFSVDIAFRVFQHVTDRVASAIGGAAPPPPPEPAPR